jgi:hypothetical protein
MGYELATEVFLVMCHDGMQGCNLDTMNLERLESVTYQIGSWQLWKWINCETREKFFF